ncbi:MAG: gluconate 2-dehydrogenase subunit 3 family protein [Bacteroidota bacterium]
MKRRIAIKYVSSIMGLAISGSTLSALNRFSGLKQSGEGNPNHFLNIEQSQLVDELTEIIIPATKTPGAKEAKVAAFIDLVLADCYGEKEKKIFTDGLQQLMNYKFLTHSSVKQKEILENMERESMITRNVSNEMDCWRMLKELTLLGYFSSEVGIKSCFDYQPVPGKLENVKWENGMKMIAY